MLEVNDICCSSQGRTSITLGQRTGIASPRMTMLVHDTIVMHITVYIVVLEKSLVGGHAGWTEV